MQFKHPEILYALFALLIPVLIHLFQLQRFVTTRFTNVKFLKQIEQQTRKSSRLKKYLVLAARLLAFAAIIIAFAQPYFAKNDVSRSWNTRIYLDNSLSMKAKGNQGELLKKAVQDLAENIPGKGTYNLITNDDVQTDLNKEQLIDALKNTTYTPVNSTLETVFLRINQWASKQKDLYQNTLLISDFQNIKSIPDTGNQVISLVQLLPEKKFNISIDSVFTTDTSPDNFNLNIVLHNRGNKTVKTGITALDKDIILAKSTIDLAQNSLQTLPLIIPKTHRDIVLKISDKDCYLFDNTYYLSFQKTAKIQVLLVTDQEHSFLDKIYTPDEFHLIKKSPKQISFELLDRQQFIVLNTDLKITDVLLNKLKSFVEKGGSLVMIPTAKSSVNGLNNRYNSFALGKITDKITDSLLITQIHFSHPILKNVFEKKIRNFQYPAVHTYFDGFFPNEKPILSFENNQSFISEVQVGKGKVYLVAAALDKKTGNFTQSPLVVPVFYNMAKQSFLQTQLSYRLGKQNKISVPKKMENESVVHLVGKQSDFIPRQEIYPDKIILYTDASPRSSGFYQIKNKDTILQNIAYNTPKEESKLQYLQVNDLVKAHKNILVFTQVKDSMTHLANLQSVQSYFKWFVLIALFFLLIEIFLLKFL